jgi:uncharacterized tellurite resistance protein B-like protein
MLKALTSWFLKLVDDPGPQNPLEIKDCQLAIGALLVRLATIDREMSETRRSKLHAVLKSSFALDDLSTNQLIDAATAADRNAIDLYHFTRKLNSVLDDENRRRVVKMMWEVVQLDRRVSEYENNVIWRVADLLGVPSRQRIALRQQTAADEAA